jgi:hypothetical protein
MPVDLYRAAVKDEMRRFARGFWRSILASYVLPWWATVRRRRLLAWGFGCLDACLDMMRATGIAPWWEESDADAA